MGAGARWYARTQEKKRKLSTVDYEKEYGVIDDLLIKLHDVSHSYKCVHP